MRKLNVILFTALLVLGTSTSCANNTYYGLLHAHTSYSDGKGTPSEAYQRAKSKGVHVFAVTPHNHTSAEMGAKDRTDGVLISNNHDLYSKNTAVTYTNKDGESFSEKSVITAAKDNTKPDFLALYGQEFSSISKGNHINVFNINEVITVENGNFIQLLDHINTLPNKNNIVIQMNHPGVYQDLFYSGTKRSTRKKMFNDYGIDEVEGDFARLVEKADPYFNLIEIITGPAMKKVEIPDFNYHKNHGDDYYFYLSQGFHISPSVGHDNHYRTWGNTTDARMGIISPSLSLANITKAFQSHQTFATEDSGAAIHFKINGHQMGSAISLSAGDDLTIDVKVTDSNETHQGLKIELIYGTVEPQNRTNYQMLRIKSGLQETLEDKQLGKTATIKGYVASGEPEFFFIRAEEDDGDRLWSAPIWINHPKQSFSTTVTTNAHETFVWTKNTSKYYHHSWCRSVKNIKSKNRVSGTSPPSGRQRHNCKRSEETQPH